MIERKSREFVLNTNWYWALKCVCVCHVASELAPFSIINGSRIRILDALSFLTHSTTHVCICDKLPQGMLKIIRNYFAKKNRKKSCTSARQLSYHQSKNVHEFCCCCCCNLASFRSLGALWFCHKPLLSLSSSTQYVKYTTGLDDSITQTTATDDVLPTHTPKCECMTCKLNKKHYWTIPR